MSSSQGSSMATSSEGSDHLSNIPDSASDLGIEMEKKRKAKERAGKGLVTEERPEDGQKEEDEGPERRSKVKGQKKKKKCVNPYRWFHVQTIDKKTMIFLWGINLISLIICIIIAVVTFFNFIDRDVQTTQNSVTLFARAIQEDLQVLEDYAQQYSNWDYTAFTFAQFDKELCDAYNADIPADDTEEDRCVLAESATTETPATLRDEEADDSTSDGGETPVSGSMKDTVEEYFKENFLRYGVWRESNDFNIVAFYDHKFKFITGHYYPPPKDSNSNAQAQSEEGELPEFFKGKFAGEMAKWTLEQNKDYATLATPEGSPEAFLIAAQRIMKAGNEAAEEEEAATLRDDTAAVAAKTVYGYMIMATSFSPRIVKYAETATVCAAHNKLWSEMKYGDTEDGDWVDTPGAIVSLSASLISESTISVSSNTRVSDLEDNSPDRYCPTFPYSEADGSFHMSAFLKVQSPFPGFADGPAIRIDRPRRMTRTGSISVFSLVGCLAVLYLIVPIPLAYFIKKHLLERIRNLTNFLAKLTQQEKKLVHKDGTLKKQALSAHMDRQISMAEKESSSKGHSSGASEAVNTNSASGGSSTREYTTSSGRTSSTSSGSGSSEEFAGDDIHKLHKTLNDNIMGMEKRYYATVAELDKHRAINENFHTALRMMNMFCGRENFLMDVGEYRDGDEKMPESFEDFLKNPISIEFLKIHCRKENSLENLLFLLDVSWLEELEYTEAAEDDLEIQEQLHGAVVSSAENILAQYIVKGAPMEINVSSGVLHKLRRKGLTYMPMMFADAVKEVKLMMNTDVIFRFRKTPGYEAMCDVLYVVKNGLNFGAQSTVSSSSGSAASTLSASKDGSVSKGSTGDAASWKGHLPGGYSVAGSFAGLMNNMIATGTAARGRVAHETDATSIFAGKFHHH